MSGHGWVTPLPSGAKARCGGPGLCPVCAAEARGIAITPRVEALIRRQQQVERDFKELYEIAGQFASGQFRSEGSKNVVCVHCDAIRRDGAGFYSDNHEEDCPVRLLNEWLIGYRVRNANEEEWGSDSGAELLERGPR